MPNGHRCRHFREQRFRCPFEGLTGHEADKEEDDPDEQGQRALEKASESRIGFEDILKYLALPGRRPVERQGRFKGFPKEVPQPSRAPEVDIPRTPVVDPRQIPFPMPDVAQGFIKKIQDLGGASFLPNIPLPSQSSGQASAIAAMIGLLILRNLKRSGSTPFSTPGPLVAQSERQLAKQLRQPPTRGVGPVQKPRSTPRGARGGFHVNAAERLAGALGQDRRILGGF